MSQIKKYAAVGGAVCLVACWPLVVGQIAQNIFDDGMKNFSNRWVEGKTLTYDRGYLSSHVEVEIKVIDPELKTEFEADGFPTTLVWKSDISHGLFSINAKTTLKDYTDIPLEITTRTSLNGNTQFKTELGTVSHKGQYDGDSWMLSISPSTITGNSSVLGEIDYQLSVPSIQFDFASGTQVKIDSLTSAGHGKKDTYFWIGNQSVQINKIVLAQTNTKETFALNQLAYKTTSSLNTSHDRLALTQHITTADISVPEGKLTHFNLDFSMADLDLTSLSKIAAIAEHYSEATPEDQKGVVDALNQLFNRGFSIALDKLNIGLEAGQVETSIKLTLPQGIESVTTDPTQLIQKVQGDVHGVIPRTLADEVPAIHQGIDELIVMDMMHEKGDNYELNAVIKEGNLVFASGKKVPLTSSLMMLMLLAR